MAIIGSFSSKYSILHHFNNAYKLIMRFLLLVFSSFILNFSVLGQTLATENKEEIIFEGAETPVKKEQSIFKDPSEIKTTVIQRPSEIVQEKEEEKIEEAVISAPVQVKNQTTTKTSTSTRSTSSVSRTRSKKKSSSFRMPRLKIKRKRKSSTKCYRF